MRRRGCVNFDNEIFTFLKLESEKRNISISDVVNQEFEKLMQGQPMTTQLTDLDTKIKQKQLDVISERHRKLKNDNDYFEEKGYYPTKPRVYVETVEQKPVVPPKRVWEGEGFGTSTTTFPENVSEYQANTGKSSLVEHACTVKGKTIVYDKYKNVFCIHCGETL